MTSSWSTKPISDLKLKSGIFFVPTIENGKEFCIRVCFSFFRLPHKIKYRTISSDRVEKNRFEIFDFWSNFELIR